MMNKRMKILITYDGSTCADNALEDLLRAGLPSAAEALVMSVEEEWMPPPPITSFELVAEIFPQNNLGVRTAPELLTEISPTQELALKAKARVQELFPAWEVMEYACAGSPATEILKKAEAWHADLITAGSHGHTALGRFFFGSVSHKIVTEAHCTVRISRCGGEEHFEKEKILIGIDGSLGSDAAVQTVAARQWPAATEVKLLIVTDPLKPSLVGNFIPAVVQWVEETNREEHQWAKEIVEQQANELHKHGLKVSFAVKEGDPRRVLINAAEDFHATTLFVGARGLSGVDRFLLGSVSAAIACRTHCAVEVVRPVK
ncbi:MAG: universal stress protein [Acidobacteria bacterium]|nr:universal stress protein [Acidobacteriota bacterium]